MQPARKFHWMLDAGWLVGRSPVVTVLYKGRTGETKCAHLVFMLCYVAKIKILAIVSEMKTRDGMILCTD